MVQYGVYIPSTCLTPFCAANRGHSGSVLGILTKCNTVRPPHPVTPGQNGACLQASRPWPSASTPDLTGWTNAVGPKLGERRDKIGRLHPPTDLVTHSVSGTVRSRSVSPMVVRLRESERPPAFAVERQAVPSVLVRRDRDLVTRRHVQSETARRHAVRVLQSITR